MSAPIKIGELECLDAAATAAPWRSMGAGNQYLECSYTPRLVRAATIPELPRPWNPHAMVAFMKLDAAEVSRFKSNDAALIAAARNALPALLRLARAAARINELVGTETEECQAEAWGQLDAALEPFDFSSAVDSRSGLG